MWIQAQMLIIFDNFSHRFSRSCQILFLSFVTYVQYCLYKLKANPIRFNWAYSYRFRRGCPVQINYPSKLQYLDWIAQLVFKLCSYLLHYILHWITRRSLITVWSNHLSFGQRKLKVSAALTLAVSSQDVVFFKGF